MVYSQGGEIGVWWGVTMVMVLGALFYGFSNLILAPFSQIKLYHAISTYYLERYMYKRGR